MAKQSDSWKFETQAIHAGYDVDPQQRLSPFQFIKLLLMHLIIPSMVRTYSI